MIKKIIVSYVEQIDHQYKFYFLYQLEKSNEDFDDHIKEKHFLWNYLFYIYVLLKKDSTEYTGLEYAIMDMLSKEDISW